MARLAICACLLLLIVGPVYAEIVFSEVYQRTSGPPDIYTDQFSGPAQPEPGWVIQVLNGNADGTERISSGKLLIDGVDLGPNLFNQQVYEVRRDISSLIQPVNDVRIELGGGPGGFIHVNVASATSGSIVICPVVKTGSSNKDVKLVWTGGAPAIYSVYRSTDPQFLAGAVAVARDILGTSETACSGPGVSFIDVGAADLTPTIYFYKVGNGSGGSDPPPDPCGGLGCPEAPRIDLLSPNNGFDGDTIQIQGAGFDGTEALNNLVSFTGAAKYAQVTSASSSLLTVIVPDDVQTGDARVTVGGVSSNAKTFTVAIPARGGTPVTFQDISSIFWQESIPGTPPTYVNRIWVAERSVGRIYRIDLDSGCATPPCVDNPASSTANLIMSNGADVEGSVYYSSMNESNLNSGIVKKIDKLDAITSNWRNTGAICSETRVWPKAITPHPTIKDKFYISTASNSYPHRVRFLQFGPPSVCNYGSDACPSNCPTWNFPNDNGTCATCGGPVSGLAAESSGTLYVGNATAIFRITPSTNGTYDPTPVATGFTALTGLALDEVSGDTLILAADRGAGGPTDGKVFLTSVQTGEVEEIASQLNSPRAVAFALSSGGDRYYLVAEPNRILKLPDPLIKLDADLNVPRKLYLTNREGIAWDTQLQNPALNPGSGPGKLRIKFTIFPKKAKDVYIRISDPEDDAPYHITAAPDNRGADAPTILNASPVGAHFRVTTNAKGESPPDVILQIAPNTSAGNNYVLDFSFDDFGANGKVWSTKKITCWKRYFYEEDLMYKVGSDLLVDANQPDDHLTVADAGVFSNGDQVLLWDRKFPKELGHSVQLTVNSDGVNTLTIIGGPTCLPNNTPCVGQDFPLNDGTGRLHPTVELLGLFATTQTVDASGLAILSSEVFTEWLTATQPAANPNPNPLVPFLLDVSTWPNPPYATQNDYITARLTYFFDHGPQWTDGRADYAQIVSAMDYDGVRGPPYTFGLTHGRGNDTGNWSLIFNEELKDACSPAPNPPCPFPPPKGLRDTVAHEVGGHQFAVNPPPAVDGHDNANAWCNPGNCGPPTSELCIMNEMRDRQNDIFHFHVLNNPPAPSTGDAYEVRDHQESLLEP